MLKGIGSFLVISGMAGVLHSWIEDQRKKQKRLEAIYLFLNKSIYTMQTEKIKVTDLFQRQVEQNKDQGKKTDIILECILEEIIKRLSSNMYPNGQLVWESVFEEEKVKLGLEPELFQIIVQAGHGFFGRSREENVDFLKKSIRELEQQQEKMKEKQAQERKVWIPVGMLGSLMLVILFI